MGFSRVASPRWLLLLAILGVLIAAKLAFSPGVWWGRDGAYFLQIARHVSEGQGLVSNTSLYHQGFRSFPHRVNQSPLWPLTLGTLGGWFGLEVSGELLPEIFYAIDLLLLYLLANCLWRRVSARGGGLLGDRYEAPDLGHVAVLIFGMNAVFFRFTSLPYTEALAFGLLFATLLALDRAAMTQRLSFAVTAGALAGLALLTRGQMLGVVLAGPLALGLAGIRSRRMLLLAGAYLAGTLAALAPWIAYLATWLPELTLAAALGFASQSETASIEAFIPFVVSSTPWEYLLDRGSGVLVALDPTNPQSYFASFGWAVALVPLALALFVTSRDRIRLLSSFEARHVLVAAVVLCAAGLLVPTHHAHERGHFFQEWLFAHRHGLPFLLALLPAAAYLASRSQLWIRVATGLLLVASIVAPVPKLAGLLAEPVAERTIHREPELIEWLDAQDPTPTVIATRAQNLGYLSRANFHWTLCEEPGEVTLALLRDAGADYVMHYWTERDCPFVRDARSQLRLAASVGDRPAISLLELRQVRGSD